MCRLYGSGDKKYIRLCYQTGYPGWRLYYQGDPPLAPSGHVRKPYVGRLERPGPKRSHAPKTDAS